MPTSAFLTVPASAVQANLTGFVTRVDLADLPAPWWDSVSSAGIRVQDSSNNYLPVDIVSLDVVEQTGELYFKADLSASVDNVFVLSHSLGLPAIAEDDPIGREAVWSDYAAVFIGSSVNRVDSVAATDYGDGISLGPDNGMVFPSNGNFRATVGTSTTWTIGATAKLAANPTSNRGIATYDSSSPSSSTAYRATLLARDTGDAWALWNSTDSWMLDASGSAQPTDPPPRLHAIHQGLSGRSLWRDATLIASSGSSSPRPSGAGDVFLVGAGGGNGSNERWSGTLWRVYLRHEALSDDWLAAEVSSWETAGFYTVLLDEINSVSAVGLLPTAEIVADAPPPPPPTSAQIVIPASTVQTDLTGFVTRVDLSDLPPEWWEHIVLPGKIRVRDSSDNPVPVDVIWVKSDYRLGELYFKADLSATVDNTFTITNDLALPDLEPTDPLGRNAVWGDYDVAFVGSPTNRTGTGAVTSFGSGAGTGISAVAISPQLIAHQGVAVDDDFFYIIHTNSLAKYVRGDWSAPVLTNSNVLALGGYSSPYNHVGDGFVHDGLLYLPISEYPTSGALDESILVLDCDDFSFVARYDVGAAGHQLASLCTDGTYIYSVGYNTGPDYATSIQRWTFTGTHVDTITLPGSLPGMQGITIHDGDFWINRGQSSDTLYRLKDGSLEPVISWAGHMNGTGEAEGISSHGGRLFVLTMVRTSLDQSRVYEVVPGLNFGAQGKIHVNVPRRTSWTYGATAQLVGAFGKNYSVAGYDDSAASSDSERSSIVADYDSAGDKWGIWNSTDRWLHSDTDIPITWAPPVRLHNVHDGTSYRKFYHHGELAAEDVGVSQRPGGSSQAVFILGAGAVSDWTSESFYGHIDRAYLRNGILTDEWLEAENLSWEIGGFYEVLSPADTVEATGLLPTVELEGTVPTVGELEATGLLPVVEVDGTVPTTGQLEATGLLPVVEVDGTVPTTGQLEATGLLPVVEVFGVSDATSLGAVEATGLLPTVELEGTVPTVSELEATGLLPVVEVDGTVQTTGQLEATGLLPVVDLGGTPILVGTVEPSGLLPIVEIEADVTIPPFPSDATLLRAPSPRGVELEVVALADEPPTVGPGTPPGSAVQVWEGTIGNHVLNVESHPMPALTAEKSRMVEGPTGDYEMIRSALGRIHVFVGGVDVTFLRGMPTDVLSWQSVNPVGDMSARIYFPQIRSWDVRGTGDLSMFTPDATVELRLEKISGGYLPLWEGNLAKQLDLLSPDSESTTYECEGTFWQAAHTPHHPEFYLELTDVGVLIANALNSVPGRRYAKVEPFLTGVLTEKRGSQQQSVLERVQELLAICRRPDGVQLTLKKIAPRNYQMVWKDRETIRGSITKGARDVTVRLVKDEHTRADAVYCRGISPRGGVWANWHFPGLDLYVPPPYPYSSAGTVMNEGSTDAGTSTGSGVSDWQRRVNVLGRSLAVDGVFKTADDLAARWVQKLRGITVDGSVGPQTWNATWDAGTEGLNWSPVRLPMAWKPEVEEHLYSANGAIAGDNPAYNKTITRHAVDLNLGEDVRKDQGREIAQRYLVAHGEAGWAGELILGTDLHDGTSRFEIREGDNLHIVGHDGGTTVSVVDIRHEKLFSYLLVDELARDAYDLDAVLDRNRDALREPSARPGNPRRLAQLVRDHVVQYEDESKAGKFPRVAINGNVGLWTVLPIFVGKTGSISIAEFTSSGPACPFVVAVFGKPITANQLASMIPDPLVGGDPWRDLEETLVTKFAWIEGWGSPESPWGYHPRQKRDGAAVTGKGKDTGGFPYVSEVGGFLWVGVFTQVSCFVEGELTPGMPL